jgi:hypothetical protein
LNKADRREREKEGEKERKGSKEASWCVALYY